MLILTPQATYRRWTFVFHGGQDPGPSLDDEALAYKGKARDRTRCLTRITPYDYT